MAKLHSLRIPKFRTNKHESGLRDVFLLYWDGGDVPPIAERWMTFETDLEALRQVGVFLKLNDPKPSRIAERYFEKHHAHIYRDAQGNMAAVSIVKIPVQFDRVDDEP